MNKAFKNAIATLTLSTFVFGSGSVLLPASALAATPSYHYGKHDQHHGKRHESTKITKTGVAVVGTVIIGAIVANAIKHHKDKKKAQQEEAAE